MKNGLPLALGAVALLAVAGRVKRGSAAVSLPYAARRMPNGDYEVIEVQTGKRPRSGEGSWREDDRHGIEALVEQLNRGAVLGRMRQVGPSADWINNAWELSEDRVLFEDDDGELLVLVRRGEDDIEEEARYATLAEAMDALGLGARLGSMARGSRAHVGLRDWPYAALLALVEEKARFDARMTEMFPDQDEEVRRSIRAVERVLERWMENHADEASDAWVTRWEDGALVPEMRAFLLLDTTPAETRELLRQRRTAR